MPLPIQEGRVGLALARQFGVQGRYSMALDEVVVPVVVIAPEPDQERPAFGATFGAGGGGGYGGVHFEAPGDGQTIVVLDTIQVIPPLIGTPETHVGVFVGQVGTSGAGAGVWRDARIGGLPASRFSILPPAIPLAIDPGAILTPGDPVSVGITLPDEQLPAGQKWAVIFQAMNADTGFGLNLQWRELIPRRSNAPT